MSSNLRKGIILAGGNGTRLSPLTHAVSKQLLPLYNKPMIYYPLTTLMISGIRDFLIITTPVDISNFKKLLGNGEKWGIQIEYKVQEEPKGIAQAFLIGKEFIGNSKIALILGDNLFFGNDLTQKLKKAYMQEKGATIFAYPVKDPKRYGVVSFDKNLNAISIEEKPKVAKSKYAITGIYLYDNCVVEFCETLKPSKRGELEISDLNQIYLENNSLNVEILDTGTAWLDTGTFESLYEAGSLIKTLDNRQGLKIGYPEEVAWRMGWINNRDLGLLAKRYKQNEYGQYLLELVGFKD
tara:strand:- start:619 stop:1506 length:888 start_codon:yes stop_codon:yes gene_type:complete